MRRATAVRLVGGVITASLASCTRLDCSIPVPLFNGSRSVATRFGSQIYIGDDVERALALITGCGGSFVRIGINGNFDFADAVFAAAAQRGMRVVVLTDAAPQPVDVAAFAAAHATIQRRYAQYGPIWEIWNEPNLAQYWGAQPDVDDYSRLAIETAKALRAAGAADVWSGGTSGIAVDWIRRMKDAGVFDAVNGCAVHSYEDPCLAYNHYGTLVGLVPAGVQIHTTEVCVASSVSDQADYLRRMWYIHRDVGVATMIWCELRDGTAGKHGAYTLPYGLVSPSYAIKPVYRTAESLIA